MSPRDKIIGVATRLFAEQGYAGTTMTSIASAAGLRQPSLYYWFRNKEELLQATASTNRFPVEVVAALRRSPAGVPQKLYRLLFEDTRHLCGLAPLDYHQIESVALQRPVEFGEFWDDYRALFDGVVALISAAFPTVDARAAAAAALSLDEGLQKVYRHRVLPVFDSVEAVAHHSAGTTLSSLGASASMLRAEAMAIVL